MILNSDGSKGDRCGGRVPDPDSPLCDSCEHHHRDLIQEGLHFAMVDFDHRRN